MVMMVMVMIVVIRVGRMIDGDGVDCSGDYGAI